MLIHSTNDNKYIIWTIWECPSWLVKTGGKMKIVPLECNRRRKKKEEKKKNAIEELTLKTCAKFNRNWRVKNHN